MLHIYCGSTNPQLLKYRLFVLLLFQAHIEASCCYFKALKIYVKSAIAF
nr:MAG TPA: hypothetical protein [Caudoviricetes sp.]